MELIFEDDVKDPFEQLQKAAESGKLGNMTFEIQDSDGKSKHVFFLLSKTFTYMFK